MRRSLCALAVVACALIGFTDSASGQSTTPPAKVNNHNTYGSPLDTLMSSHLWTDVAPVQDFVKDSRRDPKDLKYEPLTGTDPDRPKPRDSANVQALQAELERDCVDNNRKSPASVRTAKAQANPRHSRTRTAE